MYLCFDFEMEDGSSCVSDDVVIKQHLENRYNPC